MGWSSEVHARRTLEYRDHVRKEKEAGIYSVPKIKGNAALLPFAVATGVVAATVAWNKEGRRLHRKDIRRIPYVGGWLADHLPVWRDDNDTPARRAAKAAARRAKLAQSSPRPHADSSAPPAASSSAPTRPQGPAPAAFGSPVEQPAPEQQPASAQQGTPKKQQRTRKRSKRR